MVEPANLIQNYSSALKKLNHCPQKLSLIHAFKSIFLVLQEEEKADQLAQHVFCTKYVIVPFMSSDSSSEITDSSVLEGFEPSSLTEIYNFDKVANQVARQHLDHKLVFSTSSKARARSRVVFLLGCHLILSHGMTYFDVCKSFSDIQWVFSQLPPASDENQPSVQSCWSCIACTTRLGWLDFQGLVHRDEGGIDMEEYMHYSKYTLYPL
jgi:hypothetical protein